MIKKYELTLTTREPNEFKVKSIDKVEADSVLELMSQLTMLLLITQKKEMDEEMDSYRRGDDDIPF